MSHEGKTELRAGSQRPTITSSLEDRHVTHLTLMNRPAMLRILSQELGSFARQKCLHEQFDDVCNGMGSRLGD
ncbi:hypothetical protein TNCV_2886011 [Trichonephila clavipes]|nr:hypothetical protein TNCV_2886011 [Trichonephila clavipes]